MHSENVLKCMVKCTVWCTGVGLAEINEFASQIYFQYLLCNNCLMNEVLRDNRIVSINIFFCNFIIDFILVCTYMPHLVFELFTVIVIITVTVTGGILSYNGEKNLIWSFKELKSSCTYCVFVFYFKCPCL